MTLPATVDQRALTLRDAADPPMSKGLAYHVRGGTMIVYSPGEKPHFSPAQGYPTPDEIAEAARLVADMEGAFLPPAPDTVVAWIKNLRTLPNGPKTDADVKAAVGLIMLGCHDLPALCWTRDTLSKAARLEWFPSPYSLDQLLRPIATAAQNRLLALKRIADMKPLAMIERGPYPVQMPPAWCGEKTTRHLGPPEPSEIDAIAADTEAALSRARQLDQLGKDHP